MKPDFSKLNGLIPAIIQDSETKIVLMLGFMNEEAYQKTKTENKVTFYSRNRKTLWTKGETSGNYLSVEEIKIDCDNDTLLIKAIPQGPTCHTGKDTCFDEKNEKCDTFLENLQEIIKDRKVNPTKGSYTTSLYNEGINRISQKVGEEATELLIEAVAGNKEKLEEETADLIFHLLVLLNYFDLTFGDVIRRLELRHNKSN